MGTRYNFAIRSSKNSKPNYVVVKQKKPVQKLDDFYDYNKSALNQLGIDFFHDDDNFEKSHLIGSKVLKTTPVFESDNEYANDIISIKVIISQYKYNNLSALYTIENEIDGLGTESSTAFNIEPNTTIEDVQKWFNRDAPDYCLNVCDTVLAYQFFEDTLSLAQNIFSS